VPPESTLRAFYDAVNTAGGLNHQIMLRLLFYAAVRVSEPGSIRVSDVDLEAGVLLSAPA
jgi:integrase